MTALQGHQDLRGLFVAWSMKGYYRLNMRTALANAKQEKRISWPIWSVIIIFPYHHC